MLKKKVLEINFEKINLEKNLNASNVAISTKSGEKSFNFFSFFGCATQNKPPDMMELVSRIFFSSKNLWCKLKNITIILQRAKIAKKFESNFMFPLILIPF